MDTISTKTYNKEVVMKYFLAITLSVGLLLSLNSCTKCDQLGQRAIERGIAKGIERGTGGQVDIGIGHEVRLPAGFPRELVPPGGKAIAKWSTRNQEGGGDAITFETRTGLDRVISHYENLSGWTSTSNFEGSNGTVMSLEAGSEKAVVTVAEGDKAKTTVSVIYTKE
jgi:hypothetical protein